MAQAGLLNIELFNLPVSNVIAKIYSSNGNLLFTNNSSGKSYINFSGISVQPGNYFCLIAGTPDNLSWQYAYGLKIGYNPPVILPINDLEFTATAFQNNAVDLLLKKASTNVFEKYELQHSINSYDWLSIDSTSSSNLINGIYQYRDLHPSFTFANLYRVKTTMENGVVKYSMIRTVTFNGTIPPISVFPNPAHHFTQIRINIKHPKTSLIISDISGRVIYQQVLNETSPDLITVPTTLFSNGYYIVRMLDDQINYCEKLIVLRN